MGSGRDARRPARAAIAALVLSGALLPLGGAKAADPSFATITPTSGPVEWEGAFTVVGANVSNFASDITPLDQTCPGDAEAVPVVHECDVFELTVDVPEGYWATRKGGVRVDLSWEFLEPSGSANDFDMYIYRKPSEGQEPGNIVASSAAGATTGEHALLPNAEGTYLIRVNPFLVVAESYRGKASFFNLPPIPTVVAARTLEPGLAPVRASRTGYLSYSEPHIAINPLDPNNLVAGSKMYQNLGSYLFKIGTFVSFDGGRTWKDNGHLPGYPRQTGNEARPCDPGSPACARGLVSPSGEEYWVTSDVWMAFDDEGNAYTMVLDHPPNDSPTGAGWGMTLHKSVDGGRTWSDRIPIHENSDPISNALFLDDKNTIIVDNYGPDRDGKTGNMYACWGFSAFAANLAQVVTRSTDGGQTWSDPVPVSAADRLTIGCQVIVGPPASEGEPGVVYVFYLNVAGDSLRMAKSTDGGQTFSPPATVREISQIPRVFPNSAFRNFSLPWAGVDPTDGTVYLTWADYHATVEGEPCPPDEFAPEDQVCDADILMVVSQDGGETWSEPIRVNQDPLGNGKDQFQQALAVTPKGQLNMMWFDRRNDPANFYIDTYFARSNDAGETWAETRLTRTMWDPSVNPPISPSGHFIGDYQGIVATDEVAIPFWNDTTLANLPASDSRRSRYQEVFSARVPNTTTYGGTKAAALPKPAVKRGERRRPLPATGVGVWPGLAALALSGALALGWVLRRD